MDKKDPNNSGVSMLFVLAVLIVVAFVSTGMMKMSTSDNLGNRYYRTSETARSAAKSGIIYAVQQLEDPAQKETIITILNNWIKSGTSDFELTDSDRWLAGGDGDSFKPLSPESNLKFKTEIIAFDKNESTIALRSEGCGMGNSRATNFAVYHLDGLEWDMDTLIDKAPNLKNALYFAGTQTINNSFEINGNVYSESNVHLSAHSGTSSINGTFVSEGTVTLTAAEATVNGNMYVDGLEMLASGATTTLEVNGKLGIEGDIGSRGVSTITTKEAVYINGSTIDYGSWNRPPEVDNINNSNFYYTSKFIGEPGNHVAGIASPTSSGAENWKIEDSLQLSPPPRPTINLEAIPEEVKLYWSDNAIKSLGTSSALAGSGLMNSYWDGEILDSVWSYAKREGKLWGGCDENLPEDEKFAILINDGSSNIFACARDEGIDGGYGFHKRVIIINYATISFTSMVGIGNWYSGWPDCSDDAIMMLYNAPGATMDFAQSKNRDHTFRGYILNESENFNLPASESGISHISGAFHDLDAGSHVYHWGGDAGIGKIDWNEEALSVLQNSCLVKNLTYNENPEADTTLVKNGFLKADNKMIKSRLISSHN